MNKEFEISDDAGFLGLVNTDKYLSFIGEDWEFEQVKKRIISESNNGHLLFWGTEIPNIWVIRICDKAIAEKEIKSFEGKIKVTNSTLYLINYESITAVAQFDEDQLPEDHLADLHIRLDNGIYDVTIRQLLDPENDIINDDSVTFEIVLQISTEKRKGKLNTFDELIWSEY
jgi:hypothetical protein